MKMKQEEDEAKTHNSHGNSSALRRSSPGGNGNGGNGIQGNRPAPLRICRDSHKINPAHQQRQPVIIYAKSPEIIHAKPQEFMQLVQRLTGSSSSSSASEKVVSQPSNSKSDQSVIIDENKSPNQQQIPDFHSSLSSSVSASSSSSSSSATASGFSPSWLGISPVAQSNSYPFPWDSLFSASPNNIDIDQFFTIPPSTSPPPND